MKLISIETQIIKATIGALLAPGFELGVNDGEETTVSRSRNADEIFDAMKTTDEDYLYVYRVEPEGSLMKPHMGWVRFIYGNDDTEVINDYSMNLEPIMALILDLIDGFAVIELDYKPVTNHWEDDAEYPVADWQYEVANNDTRQSYAEWLKSKREERS